MPDRQVAPRYFIKYAYFSSLLTDCLKNFVMPEPVVPFGSVQAVELGADRRRSV